MRNCKPFFFLLISIVNLACANDMSDINMCKIESHEGLERFLSAWEQNTKAILTENGIKYGDPNIDFTKPGADKSAFDRFEDRFSLKISEQFHNFYSLSDGLDLVTVDGTMKEFLFGLDKIVEYSVLSPGAAEDWIADEVSNIPDETYFVYGENQNPYNVRLEYLKSAIALSQETANSTILLNREVLFDSGEYEIWDLSPYIDGAVRYDSYYSFLEETCKNHLKGLKAYFLDKRKYNGK